jgi:TrmH family RNA methyltransferase
MRITSRDNSLLRQARLVRDGKDDELIYIEGLRLADEALRSGLKIEAVIFSDELARKERVVPTIEALAKSSSRVASVSERLLESISFTKTPQGIVVLAQRPAPNVDLDAISSSGAPLLVVLHQINNPVNVGAILRTAEAAGAAGVIATKHTSDPLSPKSLRGAMGSAFRLPLWTGSDYSQAIGWCKSKSISTVSSTATAARAHTEMDWTTATALIVGPESTGLKANEIQMTDHSVKIPMCGEVESLNVSVAAGIILFEAARQRRFNR